MDDPPREDAMRRTHKALATLALGLALVAATTAAAAATPPTRTPDQATQQKALNQSELDTTQARHRALGALGVQEPAAQRQALSQSELGRTLARHRALGALDAIAAPPASAAHRAARTDPAAPSRPGVDVPATLLVGLVGGLLGGVAVVVGWTATTRRRRPRPAAGT
jgi:hypothetical protein